MDILLQEFKKIDQRFHTATVDRKEIARLQAEVAEMAEKLSSLGLESSKQKDTTQQLTIKEKKLKDNLKHSKAVLLVIYFFSTEFNFFLES